MTINWNNLLVSVPIRKWVYRPPPRKTLYFPPDATPEEHTAGLAGKHEMWSYKGFDYWWSRGVMVNGKIQDWLWVAKSPEPPKGWSDEDRKNARRSILYLRLVLIAQLLCFTALIVYAFR